MRAQVFEFPQSPWADSVFKLLDKKGRIAQLMMVAAYPLGDPPGKSNDSFLAMVQRVQPGGVIMFKGGPASHSDLLCKINAQLRFPALVGIDGEWGLAMRFDSTLRFPRQMSLGAIKNDTLIEDMGLEIAREMKALGIHWNFAPVVDINNNPLNPVIADRSFGEDKKMIVRRAEKYQRGLMQGRVLACIKHFPGHGDTHVDSHLDLPDLPFSRERLWELELYPFKEMIKRGACAVMVGHLFVPAFDTAANRPATLSPKITRALLRDSLGFKGLIVTDALNMKGVAKFFKPGTIEVEALRAGADLLLFPQDPAKALDSIVAALDSGRLDSNLIWESVMRVLNARYWSGAHIYNCPDITALEKLQNNEGIRLRNHLVRECITVAQDRNKRLPLQYHEGEKWAVISIGSRKITPFQETLLNYCKASVFYRAVDKDSAAWYGMADSIRNLKPDKLIISIHDGNRDPAKYYGLNPFMARWLNAMMRQFDPIVVSFSIPYALSLFAPAGTTVIGYQDIYENQIAAGEAIMGAWPLDARMPVKLSAYPEPAKIQDYQEKDILRSIFPQEAGLSASYFARIDSIAADVISKNAAPGMQVLMARGGDVFFQKSYGKHGYDAQWPEVKNSDLYDLASISKVAATTLVLMKLDELNKIDLKRHASHYLHFLRKSNKKNITLNQLLTHTAGLPAFIPFYKNTLSHRPEWYRNMPSDSFPYQVADSLFTRADVRDSLLEWITDCPVKPAGEYVYSDLGMFLLQAIIEEVTGKDLATMADSFFYKPLGLPRMGFHPLNRFSKNEIGPTELDSEFRGQLIHGHVHDPAAAMLGGVGGNAGLFSNARDLAVLMQMLLNGGTYGGKRFLHAETIHHYTQRQSDRHRRGLGFDRPEAPGNKSNPASDYASQKAFGHSGFTGTMVWADPEYDCIFIFLSNRVHPSAAQNKLATGNYRTRMMDVMYEALRTGSAKK